MLRLVKVLNRCNKAIGDTITVGGVHNTSDIPEGTQVTIIGYTFNDETVYRNFTHSGTRYFKGEVVQVQRYLIKWEGKEQTVWPEETLNGYREDNKEVG